MKPVYKYCMENRICPRCKQYLSDKETHRACEECRTRKKLMKKPKQKLWKKIEAH